MLAKENLISVIKVNGQSVCGVKNGEYTQTYYPQILLKTRKNLFSRMATVEIKVFRKQPKSL